MTKLKATFKTDILFKMLFVKYPDLLIRLVAHLLRISYENITEFIILNPEMTPDFIDKKYCRLDISMKVNGQHVNLEVQVENEKGYPERVLFYWAKNFSNLLPVSGKYHELPRTIVINILNFRLFKNNIDFYSEYQITEKTHHTILTNKFSLCFFELPKLPKKIDKEDLLLLWLSLFKADTDEELKRIDGLGVPELSKAVSAFSRVTTSTEYQELERMRFKAECDEANALALAEERGEERGEKREKKRWQGIIKEITAEKDAEIEEKDKMIAKLQAMLESK